jgi:hypothetical protein
MQARLLICGPDSLTNYKLAPGITVYHNVQQAETSSSHQRDNVHNFNLIFIPTYEGLAAN